jgi:hypothetical protein
MIQVMQPQAVDSARDAWFLPAQELRVIYRSVQVDVNQELFP